MPANKQFQILIRIYVRLHRKIFEWVFKKSLLNAAWRFLGGASLLLERVCAFMARPDSIDRNSTWKSTTTSPRISLDEHSMYVLLNIPLKSTPKRRLQRERLASSILKWIFHIKDAFDFMRAHSHLLIFILPLHYYDRGFT